MALKNYRILLLMTIIVMIISSCNSKISNSNKIDREALVRRHTVKITQFDTLGSLTVGNGKFAFTVDATRLQTFPEYYEKGISLGTQSEWGWHSFPDTVGYRFEETAYENTFTGPLYLLLNTAVGGSWGGDIDDSIFPQKFLIDYVRVYKL